MRRFERQMLRLVLEAMIAWLLERWLEELGLLRITYFLSTIELPSGFIEAI
jgi:hypothetical protein